MTAPHLGIHPPYVAGLVTIPANQVRDLLALIRAQLEPDCPGGATEIQLVGGSGVIYVGAYSRIAGPLTQTNWAYQLTQGDKRLYRSTYPGNQSPLGDLQVLSATVSQLHVEVQA